ncbi:hypothetical protein M407DRAFT_20601 [Tulasnella calospora MUT 4182]|uniref:Uncharacterized protein n=1 Tax=Tulasnella calospora MUT 4182 TaxID=1051891 RepID=A0A0C3M9I6_9AGAM|nr:hypothetical protein M407DRAFT_20601 [Tulasnella calospora MUT 4182]
MPIDGRRRPTLTSLLYERGEISKDVGLEEKSWSLVHIPGEESGDDVNIQMRMLWKAPSIRFTARYLEPHVYVFWRTVLDMLAEELL